MYKSSSESQPKTVRVLFQPSAFMAVIRIGLTAAAPSFNLITEELSHYKDKQKRYTEKNLQVHQ